MFKNLSEEKSGALITYVCCGDISIDFSEELIAQICTCGADVVELGVPFSDPMADGKAVQAASNRALKNGVNIEKITEMAKRLRSCGIDKPFVLFSYFNPILKMGIDKVLNLCVDSGINAIATIDVPLEEADEVVSLSSLRGIDFIPFASSTTSVERIAKISQKGSGFLYYISPKKFPIDCECSKNRLLEQLKDVCMTSSLPVALDANFSNIEDLKGLKSDVDAVVIPSAIVDMVYRNYENFGRAKTLEVVGKYVSTVSRILKNTAI